MSRLPSIGVTTCSRQIGLHACHISGDTSVRAAAKGLPALPEQLSPSDILDVVEAPLFSGTSSNIDPVHYSGPASTPGTAHDSARVATPCPLIRAGVGVPARTAFAASVQTRPQWQVSFNPHGLAMAQTRQRDADASNIA
ncbi:hypothetical protein EMIT0P176_10364 [Pseudomonas sp. IT-P176]|uniref:gamma-glutamyl-gamma-aminobutyrate hydrolase family protein n=1 Tax=Pseudomonas sp. S19 TaxID=322535 RepID=UPI001356C86C|nr:MULTISPECIES: gamma-glutamyl-gamma-aminobutyrate hydrolase family protein [unclassified Pseudomonas]